jgi:hypothetical protein
MPTMMTAKEYKAALAHLKMSQVRAGKHLGVSGRTGQNYAADGPPAPVAKIIRLLLAKKITWEDLR